MLRAALDINQIFPSEISNFLFRHGAEYADMIRSIYPALDIEHTLNSNPVLLPLGILVIVYPAENAARLKPIVVPFQYIRN